jgi:hypothetical protein
MVVTPIQGSFGHSPRVSKYRTRHPNPSIALKLEKPDGLQELRYRKKVSRSSRCKSPITEVSRSGGTGLPAPCPVGDSFPARVEEKRETSERSAGWRTTRRFSGSGLRNVAASRTPRCAPGAVGRESALNHVAVLVEPKPGLLGFLQDVGRPGDAARVGRRGSPSSRRPPRRRYESCASPPPARKWCPRPRFRQGRPIWRSRV